MSECTTTSIFDISEDRISLCIGSITIHTSYETSKTIFESDFEFITIDSRPLFGKDGKVVQMKYGERVGRFLDDVYYRMLYRP